MAKQNNRQRLINRIHVAATQLQIDEETRRQMQQALTGKASCKDMKLSELMVVDTAMQKRGFKPSKPDNPKRQRSQRKPNNFGAKPLMSKIEALLADMQLPWSYATGIAKKMYAIERLEFCNEQQLRSVVSALVKKQQKASQ